MKIKRLLDTNICIYIAKNAPPEVAERFKDYKLGEIAVSALTVAELQFGAAKSNNPEKSFQALERFLRQLEVVVFGTNAASHYGRIRALLASQGTPIGPIDTLIAAHALSLGVVLVTNNTREFQRVPGLKLENWVL